MDALDQVRSAAVRGLLKLRLYEGARSLSDNLSRLKPSERARHSRMKALYGMFAQAGQLVFDIGANVGNRAAIFVEMGMRVVAAEPQPGCVERLHARFDSVMSVKVVPMALGRAPGKAEMQISQANVISSMSPGWLSSVQASGRFGVHGWDRTETVGVTTLDALIAENGDPVFCKLDVEGFESEVLGGLSKPLRALSFECTPEYMSNTVACIERLAQLGDYEYNFDVGEGMMLRLERWATGREIQEAVQKLDRGTFADIYARLRTS